MVKLAEKRSRRAAANDIFLTEVEEQIESEAMLSDAENEPAMNTKRSKKKDAEPLEKPDILTDEEDFKRVFLIEDEKEISSSSSLVIELDTFWPSPMNSSAPSNDKLLLVDIFAACGKDSCDICKHSKDRIFSLKVSTILSMKCWSTSVAMNKSSTEDRAAEDKIELSNRFRTALEGHPYYNEKIDPEENYFRADLNKNGCRKVKIDHDRSTVGLVTDLYAQDLDHCQLNIETYSSNVGLFQYYCNEGKIYVYLDTSIEDFSSQLSECFFKNICCNFLKGRLRNGGIELDH